VRVSERGSLNQSVTNSLAKLQGTSDARSGQRPSGVVPANPREPPSLSSETVIRTWFWQIPAEDDPEKLGLGYPSDRRGFMT
jgi:hypothetical protein